MSHLALRRVMVRLLHDPTLVDALHADADRALAGVDLTPAERGWLLATPRAAWATDPERPARVMAALRDEYPAATALALDRAATFFASPAFHDAVQGRGSLALALGTHLAAGPDRTAAAVARVEQAIAVVRRAPAIVVAETPADGMLALSGHAVVVRVPAGTPELLAAAREGRPPPALGDADEDLLVVRHGDGATVESLPAELAALLAAVPLAAEALRALARRLGAEPGEDAQIVDGLVRDGVLVRVP